MQRFFTQPENVKGDEIFLYGGDVNHMKQSLRMKIGEQLEIRDSRGKVYLCSIKKYFSGNHEKGSIEEGFNGCTDENDYETVTNRLKGSKNRKNQRVEIAVLQIEKEWQNDTELSSRITLFQGLPKSDKMELIIQKAVELGVYQIIPVSTARTIVKMDEKKTDKKVSRWNSISESAAKQSGRGIIPEVTDVMSFSEALEHSKGLGITLIPYELAKEMYETKGILKEIKAKEQIGIFIGPEGGFEQQEVEKAVEAGAHPITLGKRILRTETAAITMLSILMFELS